MKTINWHLDNIKRIKKELQDQHMTKKNKPGQGRPTKIKSTQPLQRISTRISVEAIAILDTTENKAVYIDEAIKEKNIKKVNN